MAQVRLNYLQLVQRLQTECGVSGAAITTTSGQYGEPQRLCNYINSAWLDIAGLHEDWEFLETDFSFATNAVTPTQFYDSATICGGGLFGAWRLDSFRLCTAATNFADEQKLGFLDWPTFRDMYQYGSARTNYTRPALFTVDPAKRIGLGPIPDLTGYTVLGRYYQTAQDLVNDTDYPSLPVKYQLMIVYRAMVMYGLYEAASEVLNRGQSEYARFLSRLQIDQMPAITFGAALA